MSPEAEAIYQRIRIRPRRLVTPATVQTTTKPATKTTTKKTANSEAE